MDAQTLSQLISARRSCRAYTGEQVPQELLQQVLSAGQMAPSGGNVQQCHFIVLRNRSHLTELRDLVTRIFANMAESHGNPRIEAGMRTARKGPYEFFYGAPTLIAVANCRENVNNLADSATALQNMMLMATALSLGNCWINQLRWLNEAPELLGFLSGFGLKDGESIYGSLALGWPQEPPGPPLPRTGNLINIFE